jgi:uncharacterized protein involved in exopolysaccharide biosynthesis
MAGRDPNLDYEQDGEGEEGGGFDVQQLKEVVGFAWRTRRRRPKLFWSVFGVVAGLGLVVSQTIPSVYGAEVKLLAQPDLVLPALGNPGRAVPRDADDPTRNVAEMIMRRESLVALVKDADLIDRFETTRSPALRLKDRVLDKLRGPLSEENKLRGLVAILEKKITVTANGQTLTIGVDWADPDMACDLVLLLQKNFMEARYDTDVAVIGDAINMLQEHAKTHLADVDAALAEIEKVKSAREAERLKAGVGRVAAPAGAVRPRAYVPVRPAAPGAAPVAVAAPVPAGDAATALDEKRQQIRALEAEHQRAIDAAQTQLAQAQLTYTPLHPTVVALKQKLDALNVPTPELEQLKADERALMAQIVPLAPAAAAAVPAANARVAGPAVDPGAPAPAAAPAVAAPLAAAVDDDADPAIALLKAKLGEAVRKYQEVEGRIDSANIELDITRTAFKYRYTVLTPAEVPSKPKKPIAMGIGIGAIPLALLLAMLIGTVVDLARGRVVETWQVRRKLKMEVLGELELPG